MLPFIGWVPTGNDATACSSSAQGANEIHRGASLTTARQPLDPLVFSAAFRYPSGPEAPAWEIPKMPIPRASKALSRFTVLDLTRVRSGPTCVRQLADWGANVIKIEMPPQIEAGEGPGGPRDGSDFQNLHRNKRSMTLNLKSPEGVAVLKRLVKKADVVVDNFRPDVKRRLGIDYKDLRKVNPRIVYGSISGFGQDGPYENRPGGGELSIRCRGYPNE